MDNMIEICDRCGGRIGPGDIRYLVRLSVNVDDGGVISGPIGEDEIDAIIRELSKADPEELERDVHEERSYIICPRCRREFMKDPLGKKGFE